MPASNRTMISKLQGALNTHGCHIAFNSAQFYNPDGVLITMYKIAKCDIDKDTGKKRFTELFTSPSQIQCVFYLRDLWYAINGWEIPTDNQMWEAIKQRLDIQYPKLIEDLSDTQNIYIVDK